VAIISRFVSFQKRIVQLLPEKGGYQIPQRRDSQDAYLIALSVGAAKKLQLN
jgi:hypothetical protein